MTKTGAITGPKHFTAAEAQLNGLIKPGEAWDEATQKAIPRGEALEIAQLERPLDLAQQLATYQRNRKTLANFVRQYFEEAEYDARGNLVPGKLRDYYQFPGAPEDGPKALTKRGAEKLGQLYRYGRGVTRTVDKTETAEYTAATIEVELIDQYRRPIGSGVGSCTTAEGGFQTIGARKKYGGVWDEGAKSWKRPADYRAALNDVVQRASKRAYAQAMIYATGADEFFTVAREDEAPPAPGGMLVDQQPAPAAPTTATDPGPFLPKAKSLKQYGGLSVRTIPSDALAKIGRVLSTKTRHPKLWEPTILAIATELEHRELELRDDDEELPL